MYHVAIRFVITHGYKIWLPGAENTGKLTFSTIGIWQKLDKINCHDKLFSEEGKRCTKVDELSSSIFNYSTPILMRLLYVAFIDQKNAQFIVSNIVSFHFARCFKNDHNSLKCPRCDLPSDLRAVWLAENQKYLCLHQIGVPISGKTHWCNRTFVPIKKNYLLFPSRKG